VISLGLTAERAKGMELVTTMPAELVSSGRSWFGGILGRVIEPFAGAWQRNIYGANDSILTQSTVWSCITLIMQDIGKLGVDLIERQGDIWVPTTNNAYSPFLRRPNHYQNRIKFFEYWVTSKLTRGNTYVLKERDARGVVRAGYILEPSRVEVLIAPNSEVFYRLSPDNLAGGKLVTEITVPASEIIHDVGVALFHPLCGLSPLVACAMAASQSLSIQATSSKFFQNNSKPGGVLTAPGQISDETAARVKAHWESNYAGEENFGKVAVLGNGLKYEPMAVTAVEADLIKQLGWTDEKICSVFHVPPFMVGVGPQPTYDNIEKLNQQYYQQALQELIECIELCLDEGLELSADLGIRFDLDNLLRMDQSTLMATLDKGKNYLTVNEGRKRLNQKPVTGGDTVYRQHQDYSLEALAKRDAKADPFGTEAPAPAAAPEASSASSPADDDETAKSLHLIAAKMSAENWISACLQS
jgi:HK97 family phage portal protein